MMRTFYHLYRNILLDLKQSFNSARKFDISIFHEFKKPPGGGGHQFLRALQREFERHNLFVENNTLSPHTATCLFNSFNFDFQRLEKYRNDNCYMVHRVDGPISLYRGSDVAIDQKICDFNQSVAQATIFQSQYSYNSHVRLGLIFNKPTVIMNSTDPSIFHSTDRISFNQARRIKLISSSWSDNPNKGSNIYAWLDLHLDWEKYEYTFVGRTPIQFTNIKTIPPLDSHRLASLLRSHDIFITASKNDPCSNSLIEALACGLPAIYLDSGGHPEIVREAGLAFSQADEIPVLLSQLVEDYEYRQKMISIPSLSDTASAYLRVMGVAPQEHETI